MIESTVEGYLGRQVRGLGGFCMKWVSPGSSGVPDRIVVLKGGRVIFVETKAPGKKPRALQRHLHAKLRSVGCDVRVIDTKEKVDLFIEEVRSETESV